MEDEQPDVVVVATGSEDGPCHLPGADLPHVMTYREVLARRDMIGDRVLIIDDIGFHQAASTAEYLCYLGKKVTILTAGLYVGPDLMPTMDLELWYMRMLDQEVEMIANSIVTGINQGSVSVLNHYSGQQMELEGITTVVLVGHGRPRDQLYHQIQGKAREVYRIGDCLAPRRIEHAIFDGFKVGRSI